MRQPQPRDLVRRRKQIGAQLRTLRIHAGVTVDAIAAACGVSRFVVLRWERGGAVPLEVLPALTRVLKASVGMLYPVGHTKPLARAA